MVVWIDDNAVSDNVVVGIDAGTVVGLIDDNASDAMTWWLGSTNVSRLFRLTNETWCFDRRRHRGGVDRRQRGGCDNVVVVIDKCNVVVWIDAGAVVGLIDANLVSTMTWWFGSMPVPWWY